MTRDEAIFAGKLVAAGDQLAAFKEAIKVRGAGETIGLDFGVGPVDADGRTATMGIKDALFPRDFAVDLIFVMQALIDHELKKLGITEAQ